MNLGILLLLFLDILMVLAWGERIHTQYTLAYFSPVK